MLKSRCQAVSTVKRQGVERVEISSYCDVCDKPFTTKRALLRHCRENKTHLSKLGASMAEPSTCQTCKQGFSRDHDLKRHAGEVHNGLARPRKQSNRKSTQKPSKTVAAEWSEMTGKMPKMETIVHATTIVARFDVLGGLECSWDGLRQASFRFESDMSNSIHPGRLLDQLLTGAFSTFLTQINVLEHSTPHENLAKAAPASALVMINLISQGASLKFVPEENRSYSLWNFLEIISQTTLSVLEKQYKAIRTMIEFLLRDAHKLSLACRNIIQRQDEKRHSLTKTRMPDIETHLGLLWWEAIHILANYRQFPEPHSQGALLFCAASRGDFTSTVCYASALSSAADEDSQRFLAKSLCCACRFGELEIVKALLPFVNSDDVHHRARVRMNCMLASVEGGHTEITSFLRQSARNDFEEKAF